MSRRHRLTALMASVAVLAAAIPAAASAVNPITQRVYAPFDRGQYARFVHRDASVTYLHEPDGTYITTGRDDFPGDTDPAIFGYRSFFAFDVEATDLSVSKAVLEFNVPAHGYLSDDPSETFAIVDVTTDIDTLVAGGEEGTPGLGAIWDDLGSGHEYASRTFTDTDDGTLVSIPLDGTAKTMLQAGGHFAFGGHVTTTSSAMDKVEELFAFSGSSPVPSCSPSSTRRLRRRSTSSMRGSATGRAQWPATEWSIAPAGARR